MRITRFGETQLMVVVLNEVEGIPVLKVLVCGWFVISVNQNLMTRMWISGILMCFLTVGLQNLE